MSELVIFAFTRLALIITVLTLTSAGLPDPIRVDTTPLPPATAPQYEVGEVINLEVRYGK